MNPLIQLQSKRNAEMRRGPDSGSAHRRRVTAEMTRGFEPGSLRACVLGAGNCRDLALAQLEETFAEIHLVDIDGEAMSAGVAAQHTAHPERIKLHPDIDLTGALDTLATWTRTHRPTDDQINALIERLRSSPAPEVGGPFDLVASVCTMSQIIEAAVVTLTPQHTRFSQLVAALRHQHLRQLVELTKPGGYGLLVFDFVASDTVPNLGRFTEEDLTKAAAAFIAQGNYFHGSSPPAVASLFDRDPVLSPHIELAQLMCPWLWDQGSRIYAVAAVKFKKKA
ncbi:MAG: hypothetical protein GC162_00025 [Planctomycetes bacterium]|nr:hypothetical protein [Planctomycetota bacterium]